MVVPLSKDRPVPGGWSDVDGAIAALEGAAPASVLENATCHRLSASHQALTVLASAGTPRWTPIAGPDSQT